MSESILFLEGASTYGFATPLKEQGSGGVTDLRAVGTFEELESLLETGGTRLVVVGLGAHDDFLSLDRALWACSRLNRPVPVVALVEAYNTADALLCFQMGVTEYLGLREHTPRLKELLSRLAGSREPESPVSPSGDSRPRTFARSRRGRLESTSSMIP